MELKNSKIYSSFQFLFQVIGPLLLLGALGIYWIPKQMKEKKLAYKAEQEVTCPSLLSIARSARDTLIVMRDKSMCTEYMLKHLK